MRGNKAAAAAAGAAGSAASNMVFLESHEDVADTMRLILESTGEGIYGIESLQPLARTVAEHVGLAMANFNLR